MPIERVDLTDAEAAEDFKFIGAVVGIPLATLGAIALILYALFR